MECFPYIDDSFVVADTKEDCQTTLDRLAELLARLGFVIHPEKSVLTPIQSLVFLGFELDSVESKISLTREKEEKFIRAATDLLGKSSTSIREVAGLIGLMTAYSQAFTYAQSHSKQLEMEKIEALARTKGNFDAHMQISEKARLDVKWWLDNIRNSGRPVDMGEPEVTVFTDASMEGWGAHIGTVTAGGRWTEKEARDHINVLELRAILLALQSLCQEPYKHIRIMSDNTTAIAYVTHLGGVRSPECNEVACHIWNWAEQRDIWLSIGHIPGVENVLADYKSRNFADELEWSLNDKLFEKVTERFGLPEIDLFATRLNKKVPRFVWWHPDPEACAIDAFLMNWSKYYFYAFPPFSCLNRTIAKILRDNAEGVLVVPWWPTQPWWGRWMSLKLEKLHFRPKKGNLVPAGRKTDFPSLHNAPLGVFRFWANNF